MLDIGNAPVLIIKFPDGNVVILLLTVVVFPRVLNIGIKVTHHHLPVSNVRHLVKRLSLLIMQADNQDQSFIIQKVLDFLAVDLFLSLPLF